MKLKNIKNSVIVLNSFWICKGANGLDYDNSKTKFTVENVYKYLHVQITDTTDNFIKEVDKFKLICKNNEEFIKKIIQNDLTNLIKKDKEITLTKGLMGRYKSGPLNGYFNSKLLGYTVNDSIKKHLVNLVNNSLSARNELNNKLNGFKNKYNTKEELDVEINKLKSEVKYKDIIEFEEFKKIIRNINLKSVGEHVEDKTKEEEGKHNKDDKQILINKKLKEALDDLIKSEDYNTIKSDVLLGKLSKIEEDNFKDDFDINKVNDNNKKLISKIEKDIENKKAKEIDEVNKNKKPDELRSELKELLNGIITNSNDKKTSEIEIDFNSIFNAQTYQEFLNEEEINTLVKKIKEIINNKIKEEKTKRDDEDDDDDDEDDDKKNNSNNLPPTPTPVEDKKGYSGKNKKDSSTDKKGYSGKK